MHIGVAPALDPFAGGARQYTELVLDSLDKVAGFDPELHFTLLLTSDTEPLLPELDSSRWCRSLLEPPNRVSRPRSIFTRVRARIARLRSCRYPYPVFKRPEYARWFKEQELDWILYTAPTALSFESGFPYVIPIYDLQHRFQPEFPEVSAYGEWEWREYLFRNAIRRATLLLADSDVGKQDILDIYGRHGVSPDRIKVLPYASNYSAAGDMRSERVRAQKKYQLPARYLFYPAQFWPHKNHGRIVEALSVLKASGREVYVVLCGSYTGEIREQTFRAVMELAERLGVGRQVRHLGYVPNEDILPLYLEAAGLIMPTFFGPANIPIVEAWTLGCAVLTSDVRGIREQAGDAALLIDPRSVESLAFGMQRLWEDDALRCRLIERGRHRALGYTAADFRRQLAGVMREANERVAEQKNGGFLSRRRLGVC